ncbi:MAG: protein-L-isoaspartate(D-aspartate) O-methyltransferase [Deltaproteobacteria bacterium]|nr:MAG: protein-L-isoaspartate(D-aspartate) O-methyltransferase [Deltaproteobacteria bacterium]
MVQHTLLTRDITDPQVLQAMRNVPRHLFVPETWQAYSYHDRPLPIGHQQTISQPYIVAIMAQLAHLDPTTSRVLEVGTGSGYGAAVLSCLAKEVHTLEIIPALAEAARSRLQAHGYHNVTVHCKDGSYGHPDGQPYDAIVVTASPPELPQALLQQLAPGGRMIVPVEGGKDQHLEVIEHHPDGWQKRTLFAVRFVPMTGAIRSKEATV